MAKLIYDQTQNNTFDGTTFIVNKFEQIDGAISLLRDASIKDIVLNQIDARELLDLKFANKISRVLAEQGTLQITLQNNSLSISDQDFVKFVYEGVNLKVKSLTSEKFEAQRVAPKIFSFVTQKQHDLKNTFGEYDFIQQNYLSLNKQNPFEQFQNTEAEFIDEDSLLNDNVQIKKVESCATKPTACKNCTCGRKEVEQPQDKESLLKDLQTGNIKSSCGSCYLGDAFRCANCPYKGLPAFKQGEKVSLNNVNEQMVQVETAQAQVREGKVKLQI